MILSFSKWSDWNTCPYSYKLKRLDKVSQIPAAWTAGGTAIHHAMEAWERSGRTLEPSNVVSVFFEEYDRLIEEELDREPNTDLWFASGPYHADADIPRRRDLGEQQVIKSLAWYDKHPEQIPWVHPDGRLGIELPFILEFPEDVQVIGFVDWYGNLGYTPLGPRDYKSGRNPGKHMQLKLYDLAMDDHFAWRGEDRPGGGSGDFFMTRTGKPTMPQDLTQVLRDEVEYEFQILKENIERGEFPAQPSEEKCKFCPVRRACKYRAV